VSLDTTGAGIRLIIADNGCGFDMQGVGRGPAGRSGLGLDGMRERVEATGGTFEVESRPGQGVVIRAGWAEENTDPIE
jgi:two-component system NarL family sensor kinase